MKHQKWTTLGAAVFLGLFATTGIGLAQQQGGAGRGQGQGWCGGNNGQSGGSDQSACIRLNLRQKDGACTNVACKVQAPSSQQSAQGQGQGQGLGQGKRGGGRK